MTAVLPTSAHTTPPAWPQAVPDLPSPDDVAAAARFLEERCPGRLDLARPLAPFTTFRIGGPAALFLRADSVQDLTAAAAAVCRFRLPLLVLGKGSNLLVADDGWPGLVVQQGRGLRWVERHGDDLEAGGGTPMLSLATRAAAEGLGGISFAVAIPGTVGGGVRMNAGAHGTEISDRLRWVEVLPLVPGPSTAPGADGMLASYRLTPDQLGFGYRRSALPAGVVVIRARFGLFPQPEPEIRAEIDEARQWRREYQPVNQPNCGSVFANPPGIAAGRAVQDLGLKGHARGGVRFSESHANFVVAERGARAVDVLALIRLAQRRARDELGVELRPEVQIVGRFPEEPV